MANRGRPRVSWEHLKDRGAKPSVWQRRKLEDEGPEALPELDRPFAPNAEAVTAYIASVQREWDTFAKRCVSGEVLTRMHGSKFDYGKPGEGYLEHGATYHFAEGKLRHANPNPDLLQQCKDFAEANQSTGEWTRELSTRFLRDIVTLNEFVFDVEACRNVQRMLKVFAPDDDRPMLCKLAIVEFMSWKHRSTGEPRFDDAELLNFNDEDIAIMDRAFGALQQATAA